MKATYLSNKEVWAVLGPFRTAQHKSLLFVLYSACFRPYLLKASSFLWPASDEREEEWTQVETSPIRTPEAVFCPVSPVDAFQYLSWRVQGQKSRHGASHLFAAPPSFPAKKQKQNISLHPPAKRVAMVRQMVAEPRLVKCWPPASAVQTIHCPMTT